MIRKIICLLTLAVAFAGCTKDEWPDQPDWSRIPDPSIPVDDGFMKPAACSNTIVAHRGGASECGAPDNSMAALEYAMSLGCYGMECDIYWTKDDDIIVAHADGDCKVNNLQPWTATVAELRAAGRLSNGEELPTLEEFIRRVMVEGNCTRLVLDVKRVDKPYAQPEYVVNAARRACEIVTEMKAKHFVELICTGFNLDAMKAAHNFAVIADVPIGMNSSRSGKEYARSASDGPTFRQRAEWRRLRAERAPGRSRSTKKRVWLCLFTTSISARATAMLFIRPLP